MSEEKKTCLVVDDSQVVRKISISILKGLGIDVDEAANGQEALERCEEKLPDVILLDWNMPIMDGAAFLKEFRIKQKDTIVIFCTTENDLEKITEVISLGADEYIMKPFDATIIESKFKQLGIIK